MSSESITTDVATLKTRAMASLRSYELEIRCPSICPNAIVEIAPLKMTMKFPKFEFFYKSGRYSGSYLCVAAYAVSRACWEITRDRVEPRAKQGHWDETHFIEPKQYEDVKIVARAREIANGFHELEFVATVKRGEKTVRIAIGSSHISIRPPTPPQIASAPTSEQQKQDGPSSSGVVGSGTSSEGATTSPAAPLMPPPAHQCVRVIEPTTLPPSTNSGAFGMLVYEPTDRLKRMGLEAPSTKPAPRISSSPLVQKYSTSTQSIKQTYMFCACEDIDELAVRAQRLQFVPINVQHSRLFFRKTLLVFYFDIRTDEERKIVRAAMYDKDDWTRKFHKDEISDAAGFFSYADSLKGIFRTVMIATRNFDYGVRPYQDETVRNDREVRFAIQYEKARDIRFSLSPFGMVLLQFLEESVKYLDNE
ncbi:unnamed protein product [Caenorhabditis nigoni]